MTQFLKYSALRLLILVAVGGLAFAVGMRGMLLLVVAFVGSGVVSIFALRGSRAQFGSAVGGFFARINDRIDAATRAEDFDPIPAAPSEAGVGMQSAEQQVHPEVVEPEHHNS